MICPATSCPARRDSIPLTRKRSLSLNPPSRISASPGPTLAVERLPIILARVIIAHHIMWTAYGCWLPNDPRGSASRVLRQNVLRELGELHFGRKLAQPTSQDIRAFYQHAPTLLQHELLEFTRDEFAMVGEALGEAIDRCGYTCWACALMPDHVHMVIRRHRDQAEQMIEKIQAISRERLIDSRRRESDHPVWTRGGWKVFLDSAEDVQRSIRYVEQNPVKIGLSAPSWSWVMAYDGWPWHKTRPR